MKRIIFAMFTLLREPSQSSPDRCSDSELIDQYVRTRDSAALELLFSRHGPLVWSACCRLLGASAEAEDAFQATFLVLARKARSITNRSAFAGWLHRVAWRTALAVRTTRSDRLRRELPIEDGVDMACNDDPSLKLETAEQNEILDRELSRLPSKYRLPLILCDLESWTRDAAAAELKCPLGTLNSRLARGRDMLRRRLQRCGVTFTGLVAVSLPTAVSAAWQHRCASPSKSVQHLADTTIRSMAFGGARKAFAMAALCGMLVVGTTLAAMAITNPQGNPSPETKETAQSLPADFDKEKVVVSPFIDPDAGPLPEGAIAQLGSKRLRHSGEVTGLKYSPDGKWLASISTSHADATARLWDAATGKQQILVKINSGNENLILPGQTCRALGFSQDGKQFFVIDSESLRAFEIDSGKELFKHPFPKELMGVPGAAISPDGKTFVILRKSREGFKKEAKGPRFSTLLEIRDLASGKVLHTIEDPYSTMRIYVHIEFSPDSRFIVIGEGVGQGEQSLPVIEIATGKTVSRITVSGIAQGVQVLSSLRFVAGTDKLMGCLRGTPEIFDRSTGKPLGSIPVRNVSLIEIAPNGKTFFAPGYGPYAPSQIIDIDSGKEIARIPSGPRVNTLAFSPDGKLLAESRSNSGAITVWDLAKRDLHATAAEPTSFYGVHFGPDSNTLVIPDRGYPLINWRTGKIVERLAHWDKDAPWWEDFLSPRRNWIAIRGDESIKVVDAKTGNEYRTFKGGKEYRRSLAFESFNRGLSFSPDESRVASVSFGQTIRVRSLKTGEEIAQFTSPDLTGFEQIAFSENGRIMAAASGEGVGEQYGRSATLILIWDVDAKKQLARIEDETLFFSKVAVSPDGKWLAAGGGQKIPSGARPGIVRSNAPRAPATDVHIWDTATGQLVHTLPFHNTNQNRPGAHCAFSPDSRWLATGDANGKLRIWEVSTGEEVRSFTGHHSPLSAEFSPDGKLLVSASEDAPCYVWEVLDTSGQAKGRTGAELQGSWDALGKADGDLAFQAIGRLVANPDAAVELIRKNLKPAVAIDPKKLEKLIGDLKSENFTEREKATEDLTKIADQVEVVLQRQLSSSDSPEERSRVQAILKTLLRPTLKRIQQIRALSTLEFIGNAEAIKLLDELAPGSKDDSFTQSAMDARERLRKRK